MTKLAYLAPLAFAAALLCVPQSPAQCRRVVARHQAVVVDQVAVVQPVVAAAFLQVPVATYPVYGVGYGQGDTAGEIKALTAELARLRQQLAAPAAAPAQAPPAAMPREEANSTEGKAISTANRTAPPAVIASACLRCHGATNPKGGVSLAGDVPQLVRLRAFKATATGAMPPAPGKPVSDDDLADLAKWSE